MANREQSSSFDEEEETGEEGEDELESSLISETDSTQQRVPSARVPVAEVPVSNGGNNNNNSGAKNAGRRGVSESSEERVDAGLKGKSEQSWEDSEALRRRPVGTATLNDLRDLTDDFLSDSDATRGGQKSGRRMQQEAGRRGMEEDDHMERVKVDMHHSWSDTDDSTDIANEEGDGRPVTAEKMRFMLLPEPVPPAGRRTADGRLEGRRELEDVIDVLDHADPMLRITQNKIRGYRDYLQVIEREEIALVRGFGEDVGKRAEESAAAVADQERRREEFERRLADVRQRRAKFRGLMFDAIQDRGDIIRAHLERHGINFRAKEKFDFWRDRSGLDGWVVGFFLLSLAVVVCYVVFLTFPTVPQPVARAFLPTGEPIEFSYRLLVLTSLFIVVGLCFWMAVFKRFEWGSLATNLVLVGHSIIWGLLMHVFFQWAFVTGFQQIPLTAQFCALAFYSAATVLCSHAVLLGRIDVVQGLVMSTLQCICFAIITGFQRHYNVVDNGGAVSVWIFGGLFGLVASIVYAHDGFHHKPGKKGHQRQGGKEYNEELKDNSQLRRRSYKSSLFGWIGTMILWALWPVFNSITAPAISQGRVMATTFTALIFSCISAVAVSEFLMGKNYLRAFLNATLSGGVLMGCAHSVLVPPWIAALCGIVVGIISALGEWRLARKLEDGFKIYDTQAVLWNILIPATIGWVVAEIVTAVAVGNIIWGTSFSTLFLSSNQAGYLAASWAISIGFAIIIGAVTGFLLRLLRINPRKHQLWGEDAVFSVAPDYGTF